MLPSTVPQTILPSQDLFVDEETVLKIFGVKQKNPKLLDSSDQLNTAACITDAFLAIEDR